MKIPDLAVGPWSYVQPAWAKDGKYLYANQTQETLDYEFGDVVRIEFDSLPGE